MPWARLDDNFHDHPKVDGLSLAAVGLYTLCLTWAHRHRRKAIVPGHVPASRVRKLAGKRAQSLATELVAATLWEPAVNIDGWVIHDFVDYLPKDRDPDERREAGRRGAAKRWQGDGNPDGNLPSDNMASDSSRASAPASPTRTRPEDVNTLEGDRPVTLRTAPETKPSPRSPSDARCAAHVGVADPGPCNGCRRERENAEAVIRRDAEKRAREDERRAIACDRCDGVWVVDEHRKPTRRKCDHRRSA